jgi:hypothetical protein
MKRVILLMDDNEDRLQAMRSVVADSYPEYEIVLIDNAPDTIEWLKGNITSVALMSLDHDLGPNRERDGHVFDPGIGRDVVDYLVTQKPVCPVIVHSTNYIARDGMIFALEGSGWKASFVIPYNDLEWIQGTWKAEIEKYLNE